MGSKQEVSTNPVRTDTPEGIRHLGGKRWQVTRDHYAVLKQHGFAGIEGGKHWVQFAGDHGACFVPDVELVDEWDDEQKVVDLCHLIEGTASPDEFSNDELLRLGIGREISGPLSDDQVIREARERLAEIKGKQVQAKIAIGDTVRHVNACADEGTSTVITMNPEGTFAEVRFNDTGAIRTCKTSQLVIVGPDGTDVERSTQDRRRELQAIADSEVEGTQVLDEMGTERIVKALEQDLDGMTASEIATAANDRLAEIEGEDDAARIASTDDRSPGRITVDEMADEHGAAGQPGSDYIEALEDRLISMIDDVGEAMTQIYNIASESLSGPGEPRDRDLNQLEWNKAKLERIANIAEAREPDEDYKSEADR